MVWLHEIGHSIIEYIFGCKKSWIKVNVKPYIFFSTPGEVDYDAYLKISSIKKTLSAYGGIISNAIFCIITGLIIIFCSPENIYISFCLWLFLSLHLGEIVSYLFIGSIYLVSDMSIVANYYPKLRVPNIILGFLLFAGYCYLLAITPSDFCLFIIVYNICTVISMCAGRIIFSIKHKRDNNS